LIALNATDESVPHLDESKFQLSNFPLRRKELELELGQAASMVALRVKRVMEERTVLGEEMGTEVRLNVTTRHGAPSLADMEYNAYFAHPA
jgi:hypothetical protein